LLVALTCVAAASRQLFKEDHYQSHFAAFVTQYNKQYDRADLLYRYNVFKAHVDLIETHNAGEHSYTLGMNKFGDMPLQEFHAKYTGYKPRKRDFIRSKNVVHSHGKVSNPKSVDWRKVAGTVTPVKDQQQCGSCWAFSATGSMEGAYFIATNDSVNLSEQQLVDCSGPQGNQGCDGGLMDQAFEYVIANGGITSEDLYPYVAVTNDCVSPLPDPVAKIDSYTDVAQDDDMALETAVAMGPVSVAIEADSSQFQLYKSGVFDDADCGDQLDHGVLAVGYDTSGSGRAAKPYWIVKNSWGGDWGSDGYILILRSANEGICGINMDPSYPSVTVKKF